MRHLEVEVGGAGVGPAHGEGEPVAGLLQCQQVQHPAEDGVAAATEAAAIPRPPLVLQPRHRRLRPAAERDCSTDSPPPVGTLPPCLPPVLILLIIAACLVLAPHISCGKRIAALTAPRRVSSIETQQVVRGRLKPCQARGSLTCSCGVDSRRIAGTPGNRPTSVERANRAASRGSDSCAAARKPHNPPASRGAVREWCTRLSWVCP